MMPREVGGGIFTAAAERTSNVTALVPTRLLMTVGSMEILTCAGVTPEEGEMVIPAEFEPAAATIEKGTEFPLGSLMSMVCVIGPLLQKFPRKTTSSAEATVRGALSSCASGSTITPLSEMAYSMLSSFDRTERPAIFSESWIRSRTVRLSESMITRFGGSVDCGAGVEPGVVTVTHVPLGRQTVWEPEVAAGAVCVN